MPRVGGRARFPHQDERGHCRPRVDHRRVAQHWRRVFGSAIQSGLCAVCCVLCVMCLWLGWVCAVCWINMCSEQQISLRWSLSSSTRSTCRCLCPFVRLFAYLSTLLRHKTHQFSIYHHNAHSVIAARRSLTARPTIARAPFSAFRCVRAMAPLSPSFRRSIKSARRAVRWTARNTVWIRNADESESRDSGSGIVVDVFVGALALLSALYHRPRS